MRSGLDGAGFLPRQGVLIPALALALSWGTGGDRDGWQEQRFRGRTSYVRHMADGDTTIYATADDSNSALLRRIDRDPRGIQLEWRWRVFTHPEGADPSLRGSDDRAAGLVVLVRRGLFPWSWHALLYQWTPAQAAGTWSQSPFSSHVKTLVLRSDPAGPSWHTERRNLEADLVRAFGELPSSIEAIGIICDSDNTGGRAVSEFGAILWDQRPAGATTPRGSSR